MAVCIFEPPSAAQHVQAGDIGCDVGKIWKRPDNGLVRVVLGHTKLWCDRLEMGVVARKEATMAVMEWIENGTCPTCGNESEFRVIHNIAAGIVSRKQIVRACCPTSSTQPRPTRHLG